jgi:hypothetical protein
MHPYERHIREKLAAAHRDFRRVIEPFVKAKADIYAVYMPAVTIYPDGRIETQYSFSEEHQRYLRQFDEFIDDARARYEKEVARWAPLLKRAA